MISALFSFLGGSVFRMVWGEASAYLNKRQDHAHEVELLKVQSDLDQARHARDLEQMRLANELGVKMVEVQKDAAIAAGELKVRSSNGSEVTYRSVDDLLKARTTIQTDLAAAAALSSSATRRGSFRVTFTTHRGD